MCVNYSSNMFKDLEDILLVNIDQYSENVVSISLKYYETPMAIERVFYQYFDK